MKQPNSFDPVKHQYFIAGRPVPSVTQVLKEILGDAIWSASDWYLERGRAVHACMALLAKGKCFDYDTAIDGQVTAGRKWFADMKPEVLEVEKPVFSEAYQFGGCLDLFAAIKNQWCIIDFKSTLSDVAKIQVGAYSIPRSSAKCGMIVALQDDGNYKTSGMFKLDRPRNEFLACRSVYTVRQRLGLIN